MRMLGSSSVLTSCKLKRLEFRPDMIPIMLSWQTVKIFEVVQLPLDLCNKSWSGYLHIMNSLGVRAGTKFRERKNMIYL